MYVREEILKLFVLFLLLLFFAQKWRFYEKKLIWSANAEQTTETPNAPVGF